MSHRPKSFDCVEMKRQIQERMYEDTKDMSHREFTTYIHRRIAHSRFAAFLDRPLAEFEQPRAMV